MLNKVEKLKEQIEKYANFREETTNKKEELIDENKALFCKRLDLMSEQSFYQSLKEIVSLQRKNQLYKRYLFLLGVASIINPYVILITLPGGTLFIRRMKLLRKQTRDKIAKHEGQYGSLEGKTSVRECQNCIDFYENLRNKIREEYEDNSCAIFELSAAESIYQEKVNNLKGQLDDTYNELFKQYGDDMIKEISYELDFPEEEYLKTVDEDKIKEKVKSYLN